MKKLLFILVLASINLSSCQKKLDYSKTIQEYEDLGSPSIDKEWTYQDIESFITILEQLKAKDSLPLPKLKSEKSSKYFNKLLLELPKVDLNDSLNVNQQFQNFNLFQKAFSKLSFLYGASEKEQIYYSDESIELEKLSIKEATKTAQLYFDFLKKTAQNTNSQLQTNTNKMQNGLFVVFEASLEVHEPYHKFDPEDKIELAQTISNNLEKIWKNIDLELRNKLLVQIQGISEKNEIKEVREIYKILITKIK
jgi:hypothetical protein